MSRTEQEQPPSEPRRHDASAPVLLDGRGLSASERLALVIEATHDGVWDWDLETGEVYYSPRWKEMAGHCTPEEQAEIPPAYTSWAERTHPEDFPAAERAVRDHLEGRTADYRAEFRFRHRDGTWRWMAARGRALRRPDGSPYRIVGTQTDVTKAKAAEATLRRSEARLQRLIDASPDCVKTLTLDGALVDMNAGGLVIMEVDDFGAQMRGQHWPSFWPGEGRSLAEDAVRTAAAGGTVNFRAICPTAKGTMRWWSVTVSPLPDPNGGTSQELLCVSRDVTAEVEAEQEREKRAERDRRIATTLQESLLPRVAGPVGGVEARAVHLPLSDEAEVGGDFYDIFPLAAGRVAIVVGDVMGKGLAAALSIAEVRFSLRGFLREQGPGEDADPAAALSRLNRFLLEAQELEERPRNALVALTLGVIDGTAATLTLATAGSYPALVLRAATGGVETREGGTGLILGALGEAEYRACRSPFAPGDLLLLATDGVTEARDPERRDLFGLEGLSAALREATSGGGPADLAWLAADLVARTSEFAGGRLQDDVCLLLARQGSSPP